mgnify:CR=1 FL=1
MVNLLPLAGVLWLDWDVTALMILYWSENLVLGFYTLVKMLTVSPLGGLPMGLFFLVHYGGFCAGHGLFILIMLVDADFEPMPGENWPFFLVFVQLLVGIVREVIEVAPPAWLVAFGALFLSHGVSFLVNFLWGGERRRLRLKELMTAPYSRIIVLHVTVILGGAAVMALGQPVAMLLVLVALKLALDVKLHLREHERASRAR